MLKETVAPDKTGVHITRAMPGDIIVSSRSNEVYRIDKVARVNFQVTGLDGKRYNVRIFRSDGVTPRVAFAPAGTLFTQEIADEAATADQLVLGTVVAFHSGRRAGDKYVVIGGFGPFKLAKLGGDGNRYLRNVLASDLQVVVP